MRPFATDLVEANLLRERLLHLRVGDDIYTPVMGQWPWALWRDGYAEYFANADGKVAQSIAAGYGPPGQPRRLPAAVERVIAKWEAKHGEMLGRDREGALTLRAAFRLGSSEQACALIRAALTTANDLPGDPPWP